MIRVGVPAHEFIGWAGGVDFLRTIVNSLLCAPVTLEVHLLLPTKGPRLATYNTLRRGYRGVKALVGQRVTSLHNVDGQHVTELIQAFPGEVSVHEIDLGNKAILKSVRALNLEVLIPVIKPLPESFPVPWVGYVYDFQHRYFPEYFTNKEFNRRNNAFEAMLNRARSVIVNANTVAADILKFHPASNAKVFPLPFSAAPQMEWLNPVEPSTAYKGADRPYFIICNQFWEHKDHLTAFAAMSKVVRAYPDLTLICTGTTTEFRNPNFFSELKRQLVELKIDSSVHILGMIQKSDQISLIKNSIALIQPTLFEGGPGGGAVFDAISVGVKCIVSDISTNRELGDTDVEYFKAGDSDALARAMINLLEDQSTQKWSTEALIQAGNERRQRCGSALLAAINSVIGSDHPPGA